MNATSVSWDRFWLASGAHEPCPGLLADLLMCWSEPRRHYHTLQHLTDCIVDLKTCWSQAEHPEEICLALWFHDAIYNTFRTDNELCSAVWAHHAMSRAGFGFASIQRVCEMILTTTHTHPPESNDSALIADIDLAILGSAPARFAEYEAQVRMEFSWINASAYTAARSKLLGKLLQRPRIYHSAFFHSALEESARRNLKAALARLDAAATMQRQA